MKKIENSKLALGLSNVELDSIESKDSGLVSSIVAYSRIKAPSTEYAVLEIVEYLCGRVHTSRKMSLREASDLYDNLVQECMNLSDKYDVEEYYESERKGELNFQQYDGKELYKEEHSVLKKN